MEVEPQQLSLQVFYESVAAEEVPDDTVRKGVTVQLQISCTHTEQRRVTCCGEMFTDTSLPHRGHDSFKTRHGRCRDAFV